MLHGSLLAAAAAFGLWRFFHNRAKETAKSPTNIAVEEPAIPSAEPFGFVVQCDPRASFGQRMALECDE